MKRRKRDKTCHNCKFAEFYRSVTRIGSGICIHPGNKLGLIYDINGDMHCKKWEKYEKR